MPQSMPAGGYVTDLALFVYVAAALLLLGWLARRAGRRWLAIPLLTLGVLAALGTGAEAWLRYVHDAPRDSPQTLTYRAWVLRHWTSGLNSEGQREREWPTDGTSSPEAAEPTRIVLLGDEAVAGWGVADREELVAARLARELGPTFDVHGIGGLSWTTGDRGAWIERKRDGARIDRVLLVHALDDAADLVPAARLDVAQLGNTRSGWWNPTRSFLADELWAVTRPAVKAWFRNRVEARPSPEMRAAQIERQRRIVALCAERDILLDVCVLPWLDTRIGERDALADDALLTWRDAGAERVHDLRDAFAGREEELRVGSRTPWPNADGHAVLAARFLQILRN